MKTISPHTNTIKPKWEFDEEDLRVLNELAKAVAHSADDPVRYTNLIRQWALSYFMEFETGVWSDKIGTANSDFNGLMPGIPKRIYERAKGIRS